MHLLFCSDGYPSKGIQYSAFIGVLCEEMTRQGCDITVVAPQSFYKHLLRRTPLAPKRYKVPVETVYGQRFINVYRPYSITFGDGKFGKITLLMNRWATERCARKIGKNVDIVYSHFWKSAYNIVYFVKKKSLPLFVASGEDKIDIDNILPSDEINLIKQKVTGCICVSSKNKEESIKVGLTDETKTVVKPNSINPKEFYQIDKSVARKELGFPLDVFIVAFCGRFNHRKGAMRVAEAITLLNNPHIKSIFIGSIADNETAQPECEGILFKGTLPHSDIVKYLNCADVFVLPSLAEGCPNSVIEAMACGLPIISSNLPFNFDILNDENAILVDPSNTHEIANAIKLVKDDIKLRENLSIGALKRASELTIDKRVQNIINFIKEKCPKIE